MKGHKIFANGSLDNLTAEAKASGLSFTTVGDEILKESSRLRSFLRQVPDEVFTPTVLAVNAVWLDTFRFNMFLLVLEASNNCIFWFYGVPYGTYPITIRSRCQVVYNKGLSRIEGFVAKVLSLGGFASLPDSVKSLSVYEPEMAVEMIKATPRFLDYLFHLEVLAVDEFDTIFRFVSDFKEPHLTLLEAWLSSSPYFSAAELKLCPWIRKVKLVENLPPVYTFLGIAISKFAK